MWADPAVSSRRVLVPACAAHDALARHPTSLAASPLSGAEARGARMGEARDVLRGRGGSFGGYPASAPTGGQSAMRCELTSLEMEISRPCVESTEVASSDGLLCEPMPAGQYLRCGTGDCLVAEPPGECCSTGSVDRGLSGGADSDLE